MKRWLVLSLLAAWAGSAAADDELDVTLLMPTYGEAVFGEIEVGAEIYPPDADVQRIEFYLDDELVGFLQKPPFKTLVDAGQENVAHEFVVVAYDREGRSARALVRTPRIDTDEEISVDLQQLFVTVERGGGRALDLGRDDFSIFDNGARQDLVTFERGDVPFTAVLLVDASTSMKGRRLQIALSGAESFVKGMHELDQAKLILFADRLLFETPFTNFASVLTLGLGGVEAGGGTALNDHLYLAMKRLAEKQGRRVVVVLSDGVDVESVLSMEEVRWTAGQQQPVIYWIRTEQGRRHMSMWRGTEEHDRELELLEAAITESGGRIETIPSIEEVPRAFQAIQEDLRNQYVLGYYPKVSDDAKSWHRIDVRASAPGLAVRTRTHYLEPTRWKGGRGR